MRNTSKENMQAWYSSDQKKLWAKMQSQILKLKQGVFKVHPVSSPKAPFLNFLSFNSSSWRLVVLGQFKTISLIFKLKWVFGMCVLS